HRLRTLGEERVGQSIAERQLDALEGATGRLGRRAQLGERLLELAGRLRGGVPAVAQGHHAAKGARSIAANPDGRARLLHRLWGGADCAGAEETARERRDVV